MHLNHVCGHTWHPFSRSLHGLNECFTSSHYVYFISVGKIAERIKWWWKKKWAKGMNQQWFKGGSWELPHDISLIPHWWETWLHLRNGFWVITYQVRNWEFFYFERKDSHIMWQLSISAIETEMHIHTKEIEKKKRGSILLQRKQDFV